MLASTQVYAQQSESGDAPTATTNGAVEQSNGDSADSQGSVEPGNDKDVPVSGYEFGDLATWFSGVITALVFLFTLHAWREERLRSKELERKEENNRRLAEATKVTAWLEKGKPSLRVRTGSDVQSMPDGSWVLVVENAAAFTLFSWRANLSTERPKIQTEASSSSFGPIGPRGGNLVLSLSGLPSDANPEIRMTLEFEDDHGNCWRRTNDGLVQVDGVH